MHIIHLKKRQKFKMLGCTGNFEIQDLQLAIFRYDNGLQVDGSIYETTTCNESKSILNNLNK